MEWEKAHFIYIDGLKYYEKEIQYEEFIDGVEVIGVSSIQYSAINVSNALERAMKKEMNKKISQMLKRNPFHIKRELFDDSKDTKYLVIVGREDILVKKGCFGEQERNNKIVHYMKKHQDTLNFYDIGNNEFCNRLITIYEKMMEGNIDPYLLTKACLVIPNDVYLEILSILNGFAGTTSLDRYYEKSKEKVKTLLEHYQ